MGLYKHHFTTKTSPPNRLREALRPGPVQAITFDAQKVNTSKSAAVTNEAEAKNGQSNR